MIELNECALAESIHEGRVRIHTTGNKFDREGIQERISSSHMIRDRLKSGKPYL